MSIVSHENQGQDISSIVASSVKSLTQKFIKLNSVAPLHIILIRDGIAPTQLKNAQKESEEIRKDMENIKLTYIVLNKKANLKVFAIENNKNFSNIPPGTLVDNVVVNDEINDFFLVSQKSNQGLSQATHYQIIYDDLPTSPDQVHLLMYKLCYLYYNWTGGIKIPAPCQYAKKLAFLVGDKLSTKTEIITPQIRFLDEIRSLYFL
jgi:aubergine-like protein